MANRVRNYNPFARQESHGPKTLAAYRTLAPLSWLAVVVFGIYYSFHSPNDVSHGSTVGKQADANPTLFSQNTIITLIYWVVLLISQLGYIAQLWSSNAEKLQTAANVAPYYILNNLFVLAFILLWVRSYFWGAEIIDIANLLSQGTLYWKYPGLPASVHWPAIAGPYAWTISALFWNGAIAIGGESTSTAQRLLANIFIWVYFLIGQGHIVHRSDHHFGYSISFLSLSLALEQLSIKIVSLQWIFAFVIFGIFLLSSLNSSATRYYNRSFFFRRLAEAGAADREREPLLRNE
ncbi:hypothetical protein VTO42DRAFT_3578 [Malbranchea cinnamomea]